MKHRSNEQTERGVRAAVRNARIGIRRMVNEGYWRKATEQLRQGQDPNLSGKYLNGSVLV